MSVAENYTNEGQSQTDQMKDKAAEVGRNVRDAVREKYEDIKDHASDYYDQGRAKAREWEGALEDYIRDYPLQSLLIAAGAGVLLGMLLRRR